MLYEADKIDTFIVIAPKGVYRNWSRTEIPTHMPDVYYETALSATWNPSPNKAQKADLASFMRPTESFRIRLNRFP